MALPPRRPAGSGSPGRPPPRRGPSPAGGTPSPVPRLRRTVPRLPTGRSPGWLLALATAAAWLDRSPDGVRATRALAAVVAGTLLALGGALADATVHRGVESGTEPPVARQVTGRDLAANADLTRFTPDQLPLVATALQGNGFRFVRQSFAWSEIEPAPGQFVWDRYDAIVDELARRGIAVVAVLHRSPTWARAPGAGEAFDAPPVDVAAWERFVGSVAARYGGRVPIVQVWDLPNRPDRWAGSTPDPGAYLGLLARAANAARAANPTVIVVLAEFDPAPVPGATAADLLFLKRLYAAGAAPFFDVVAARVPGGDRTPWDRRVSANAPGLSRAILFREATIAAGDGSKPIWATHYGWAAAASGTVGLDASRAADYAVSGIERARQEWPWMGPLFAWGLAPGPDLGGGVEPGEALLGPDGLPTALLTALGGFAAAGGTAAAPPGFLPVGAGQIAYEGNWDQQHLGPDTYRTTSEVGARLAARFAGTGATARLRFGQQAGTVAATLDGRPLALNLGAFRAVDIDVPLARGLPAGVHELTVELTSPGQFTIGGLLVEGPVPLRWAVILLVGAGTGALTWGLRLLFFTVAEASGRLQRRRGIELPPELPQLPDWRPPRRA